MRVRICSMICSTLTESARTLKSDINGVSFQRLRYSWRFRLERADGRQLRANREASYRTVDDQGHGQRPQRHAREKRPVGQEQIRGAPAAFALMNQIQVPKDPVQGKRDGQAEPGGAELRLRLGRDRVEDV